MTLTCFASAKGSPGVTLTALGFAAARAAAGTSTLLLEADPSGGSLAIRYQLGRQPGLITLAAASRHGLNRNEITGHAQEIPGGLAAIVAPERHDRTAAILRADGIRLGRFFADLPDVEIVADCGRLDSETVTSGLPSEADVLYLLARPVAEEIQPAAALAATARDSGLTVAWVLIGDKPHDPAEVAEVTRTPVAAVLPDDGRAAAAMADGRAEGRGRRSRLARAIAAFASEAALVSVAETAHETVATSATAPDEAKPLAALTTEAG